jgi:hypothetical protein
MVVTSYKRHDLLEKTLASFFAVNEYPLTRIIVIEDSDDTSVRDVVEKFPGRGIEVIVNMKNLRRHASIDRAYSLVETDYIFHCEDDYEFGRGGIVQESLDIMESDPQILMVLPRDKQDLPYYLNSIPIREVNGARFRKVGPRIHDNWYTFSHNPGLRRLRDWKVLPGGYAGFKYEADISRFYKTQNWAMAVLVDGQARHIARHRPAVPMAKRFSLAYHLDKARRSTERRAAHYLRLMGLGNDGF